MNAEAVQRYYYDGPHTTDMHENDYLHFHLPLDRKHHAALHGWGVAEGLEVNPKLNNTGVRVAAGIAVDAEGQLITLVKGEANAVVRGDLLVKKAAVPTDLDTTNFAGQGPTLYVTIQYYEEKEYGQIYLRPYLRLQPTAEPTPNEIKNGKALVLAIVTIDAEGKVTALQAANPELPYCRHSVGQTVEALHVRRTVVENNTVKEALAGTIAADAAGGLYISPKLTVGGTSSLQGGATIANGLTVGGASSLNGGATIANGLTVGGASSLNGGATIANGLTVGGASSLNGGATIANRLTVGGASSLNGGATIADRLTVGGASSLNGGATIANGLTVSGASSLNGGATIANGLTVSSGLSSLKGSAAIAGGLTVSGASSLNGGATIANGLTVSGVSSLNGGATIANGLTVSNGASSLQGGVTIANGLTVSSGLSSLKGSAAIAGGLTVSGASSLNGGATIANGLTVSGVSSLNGGATIANGLTVSSGVSSLQGDATIGNKLTVSGASSLNGGATIANGLTVSGVLKIGEWSLVSTDGNLYFKHGENSVARFSIGQDRLLVFQKIDGETPPYFYFNRDGGFGLYSPHPIHHHDPHDPHGHHEP